MVYGLDFSSAEAFVRIQRLLAAKGVVLIFCGAHPEGAVGKALQAVELWSDEAEGNVQVFDTLNDALEWTENAYLYILSQRLLAASATDLVAFTDSQDCLLRRTSTQAGSVAGRSHDPSDPT